MYTPPAFRADEAAAWEIAEAWPFGLLLGGLDATPLPWLVDRAGRLRGHLAIGNPAAVDGPAAVIFSGPDAYVSPTWYGSPADHVPTWNYVVARAVGVLRRLDAGETRQVVLDLTERFEPEWRPTPAVLDALTRGIVGIELVVERFEAKLKLSQNRSPEDRARVQAALASSGPREQAVAAWMRR